eukprot:PLAT6714.1.p1 GENE.PLAT6714.1~~PLAT6714.1.p1  ORF type:complete len:567 (+),score=307.14 PLAT6714.1:50-1750(+)
MASIASRRARLPMAVAAAAALLLLAVAVQTALPLAQRGSSAAVGGSSRRLADSHSSCQLAAWEDGLLGGLVYAALCIYLFIGLAIICDVYFVAALEGISETLQLSGDVAGATFLAAGSSAPELFVSLADNVFAANSKSVGVGTIVGSAIFNILVIIAATAALAGQTLQLDWRPMARDSAWYSISIILLVIFVSDGSMQWWEAAILFATYLLYILYMKYNARIVAACCPVGKRGRRGTALSSEEEAALARAAAALSGDEAGSAAAAAAGDEEEGGASAEGAVTAHSSSDGGAVEMTRPASAGNPALRASARGSRRLSRRARLEEAARKKPSFKSAAKGVLAAVRMQRALGGKAGEKKKEEEEEEEVASYWTELSFPQGDERSCLSVTYHIISFPLALLMRLTVPDSSIKPWAHGKGYTLGFFMSIIWIGALSHFLVEWASKLGCIIGIPPPVMGLTVLAAGTSVPDAIASILVARDGQGDMAVSNAIGSNVFDILVGLGLPYAIAGLMRGQPIAVATDDLLVSIIILFAVLLLVLLTFVVSKWRLFKPVGVFLFLLYVAFVVFSLLN